MIDPAETNLYLLIVSIGIGILLTLAIIYRYYSPLICYLIVSSIILWTSDQFFDDYPREMDTVFTYIILFFPPAIFIWAVLGAQLYRLHTTIKEIPDNIKQLKGSNLYKNLPVILTSISFLSGAIYYFLNSHLGPQAILIALTISSIIWYIGGHLLSKIVNKGQLERYQNIWIEQDKSGRLDHYGNLTLEEIENLLVKAEEGSKLGEIEDVYMKGKVLFDLGKYEEADQIFIDVISLLSGKSQLTKQEEPLLEKSYYHKSRILAYNYKFEEAIQPLKLSLETCDKESRRGYRYKLKKLKNLHKPKYNLYTAMNGIMG